ncbi:hypothetical protein D9M68_954610 [compost metagenome]
MLMNDRVRMRVYFGVCVVLLLIAAIAPIASVWWFDGLKPEGDTIGDWFSRSGAITTIFSLLVVSTTSEGLRGLWIPGQLADLPKIAVFEEFKPRFGWCDKVAMVLTIIGTFIWGYGSMMI